MDLTSYLAFLQIGHFAQPFMGTFMVVAIVEPWPSFAVAAIVTTFDFVELMLGLELELVK